MKIVLVFAGNQREFTYLMKERQMKCKTYVRHGPSHWILDNVHYRYMAAADYARGFHGVKTEFYGTVYERNDIHELQEVAKFAEYK